MNELALPPEGNTQLGDELVIVKLRVVDVLISPLVINRLPFISIAPPLFIRRPDALLISKLLNALIPVKSPKAPPIVWGPEPAKVTVAPAPEPLLNEPASRLIEPWIVSFLLYTLLSRIGPLIVNWFRSLLGNTLVPVPEKITFGILSYRSAITE